MSRSIEQTAIVVACCVAMIMTAASPVRAADIFLETASNPAFMRDVHLVAIGGNRVGSAPTNDGQTSGISHDSLGVGANIWNNEHNQALAGVQFGRRAFDRMLTLPGGIAMPDRLDSASAGLVYKHITSGDWSISQGVRYTRSWADARSVTVRDTYDLVGLAVISREPGVAWAFGYIFTQSDTTKDHLSPVIEYMNNSYERWAFTLGYPVLNFAFSPHPDLVVGGGGISYKVTQQNIARFSLTSDNWAYRLEGPGVRPVAYTSNRAGLDWTYLYFIDHRTEVILLSDDYDCRAGTHRSCVRRPVSNADA